MNLLTSQTLISIYAFSFSTSIRCLLEWLGEGTFWSGTKRDLNQETESSTG